MTSLLLLFLTNFAKLELARPKTKMKSLIKTTLMLLALLLPATATAYDFEVDGIYYNYLDDEGTVEVTKFSVRYSGDVNIPSAVTYSGAAYSVTAIGDSAFFDCVGLTSVTIPSSVSSIGKYAFWDCTRLTAVNIPNSVTTMGVEAFSYCQGLTSVTIPNSVTSIGVGAFLKCNGLTSIIVESGNTVYDSRDNCNAIIETASNTLIAGCRNTAIPGSVTALGDYAFGLIVNLGNVDIPGSVTYIGEGAFIGCSGLTGVNFPNTVTSIGDVAFYQCSDLTDVTIGDSVTAIGHRAFYGCMGLTSLTLGPSVSTIGEGAFMYCRLTSLTLPSSVTSIGDYAFMHCSRITDVYSYITDFSVLSTGDQVFYIGAGGDYSYRTLHVPDGTAAAYQSDEHWYPYFGQIVEDLITGDLPGDVNRDGCVDIGDINAVIDVIQGEDEFAETADVNCDGEITIADVNAIIDIILGAYEKEHEYVDLGLPSGTLWATCNVGANSPEEYGDYFAWGETEPKVVYNWSTYKWCNGTHDSLTKYCSTDGYGVLDYKKVLDPEDDAAYVNWGSSWRMPTHEQQVELMNVCTWTMTSLNGVMGYQVTGPNGNTLFLPLAGERSNGQLIDAGSSAGYWPQTLFAADMGQIMYLYGGSARNAWTYRCEGWTVRAVRSQQLIVEQQNFDFGEVPIGQTRRGELTIVNNTAKAQTLTISADEPFLLERGEGSASSITVVVPLKSSKTVKVVFTATEPGEFNGNVTFQSPAFDGGERVIPVQAFAYSDNVPEHRYVDLGLPSGTLWATCNVGASAPEEYGDYFAWGETEPKEDYLWTTYKWCNGSNHTLTKYCTYDYFGTVDSLTVLYPEDDAATVNWGSSWCMPTKDQYLELSNYCSKVWTTRNGVNGYLYIGPSGNTLFMPTAGKRQGSSFQESGTNGYYWSRSLVQDITYSGWSLTFGSEYMHCSSNSRHYGLTVRAVRVPQD